MSGGDDGLPRQEGGLLRQQVEIENQVLRQQMERDRQLMLPQSGAVGSSGIQKLNGKNFLPWKRQITILLSLRGIQNALTDEDVDQVTGWKAILLLLETMDDEHKMQVQAETSAKAIMDSLCLQYANHSVTNKHRLLSELFKYQKDVNHSIGQHFGKMKEMRAALVGTGEELSEDLFQVILIQSIPEEFGDILKLWETTHPSQKTTQFLLNYLIEEEKRISTKVTAQALVAGNQRGIRYRKDGQPSISVEERKKTSRCGNCKKVGHWWRECPNLSKQQVTAMIAACGDPEEEEMPVVLYAAYSLGQLGSEMKGKWIGDSGATVHMANSERYFSDLKKLDTPAVCMVGDGSGIKVHGVGSVGFQADVGGRKVRGLLNNVLFVPELATNLVSIGAAADSGFEACFSKNRCYISKEEKVQVVGERIGKSLYVLAMTALAEHTALNVVSAPDAEELHKRLGHANRHQLNKLLGGDVGKLDCPDCPRGRGKRATHPRRETIEECQVGEKIHMDLSGKVNKMSLEGANYYLLCKDEASGYTFAYLLKTKSETPLAIKRFLTDFERTSGRTVKTIYSDQGSEFTNGTVELLLAKEGVTHILSATYTPQQNGIIEREMGTITTKMRTLLLASNLPKELWGEALKTATYVKNRLSTSRTDRTPFELLTGIEPEVGNMMEFGTPVQKIVNEDYLTKLDSRTEDAYIVGYTVRRNTYRVYVPTRNRVIETSDIIIAKHRSSCVRETPEGTPTEEVVRCSYPEQTEEVLHFRSSTPNQPEDDNAQSVEDLRTEELEHSRPQEKENQTRRLVTGENLNQFFRDYHLRDQEWAREQMESEPMPPPLPPRDYLGAQQVEESPPEANDTHNLTSDSSNTNGEVGRGEQQVDEVSMCDNACLLSHIVGTNLPPESDMLPKTYHEAQSGPNHNEWRKAIGEELSAHRENETWIVVKRPPKGTTLSAKWVFNLKLNKDGEIERYKARLVARGFEQRPGIDYEETFAPVSRIESLRTALSIAAIKNLDIIQFDISTAFLNGLLSEEVFLEPPPGVMAAREECLKLNKALYGLKQAPRAWNSTFTKAIQEAGFEQTESDACVYTRKQDELILVLYVDDGLIIGQDEKKCFEVIEFLKTKFKVKVLSGDMFLGMEIARNNGKLYLTQTRYIEQMVKRFGLEEAQIVSTPNFDRKTLATTGGNKTIGPYRELIGCLQYCCSKTRPDVMFAVNWLSRYNIHPTDAHWTAAKRVLRYLKGTKNLGICLGGPSISIEAFSDADWANSEEDRSSVSGGLVKVGLGPVIFVSRKQTEIAQSTTEAEYIAACEIAKELAWLSQFLEELSVESNVPILFVDNKSTIKQITNCDTQKRSKHVRLKYHYVRRQHKRGLLKVEHVPTEQQAADALTKLVPGPKLRMMCELMGLDVRKSKEIRNTGICVFRKFDED